MFRRIIIIALALSLACAPALAAGKLTVNQERMIALDSYGYVDAEVFAEVENTDGETSLARVVEDRFFSHTGYSFRGRLFCDRQWLRCEPLEYQRTRAW